ncbi:hypothetical protein J7L67_01865 [bacterium]|nr:hypothetical protein [bacterium]
MKKTKIFLILPVLLVVLLNFTGCAVIRKAAFQTAKPVFRDQIKSLNRESDYELAKSVFPSNIKLLEGLVLSYPDDTELKLWLAEALCGYSLGFVEDEDKQRASKFYLRARDYAVQASVQKIRFKKEYMYNIDKLREWINKVDKKNTAYLFWLAQAWGSYIALNMNDPEAIADLVKVQWMTDKVIELDENFYYAGAHLFKGIVYADLPPMLGGSLDESKKHFEKCFQLNHGKFLLAYYYFMKTYCVKIQDKKLYNKILNKVERFNLNTAQDFSLVNIIALDKIKKLKPLEKELFFDENE